MFCSPAKRVYRRGSYTLTFALLAILITVVCSGAAQAQSEGIDTDPGDRGTGGRNNIQGTIYLPGGRRMDRRVKVKLRSNFSGEQFQYSDENGTFMFRRLAGGAYTVTIDAGKEFEIASETVDIVDPVRRRNDPGVTIPVYITLQPKQSASTGIIGTIDASSAGVSEEARELYKKAVDLAQTGDRKKAIEHLNQAVALHPNFMTALNELGVQYIALKQFDKAIESLRTALKIGPEAFHPRLNYGIALLHKKSFKEAAIELQRAVQKDNSSAVAHLYFGRALVNIGNYDYAEKALRQAITIGGEDVIEAHRYLGAVYIEKRDGKRAADELEQYLKLAPKAQDADRIRQIIKQLREQASGRK
jgi:tetratricopeptide (TPR) repeat protein